MAKPGELNWNELFKSNTQKSDLRKTNTEKVPSAQYHMDKPSGTKHKNAYSGPSEEELKKKKPAEPINKPGEVPRRPTNIEISRAILANMPKQMRQPTHAEMVAAAKQMGLVKTKEDLEKAQKDWENRLNKWHEDAAKPIEDQSSPENQAWASGTSFNDSLTEEERQKRNMYVGPEE